ncbi:Homeobox-leucine zipper protein HDG2 [Glycine soja]
MPTLPNESNSEHDALKEKMKSLLALYEQHKQKHGAAEAAPTNKNPSLKGGTRILVFVRVRPLAKREKEAGSRCCVRIVDRRDVYLTVQEMAHIANGRDTGNCVSLLRVNSANSSQSNMLILQESCTNSTGSFVIYAPVDIVAMNVVLNGGDPDYVALLPSGFAILPDGTTSHNGSGGIGETGPSGSLLTVAFQILVDSVPTAKLSLGGFWP